MINYIFRNNPYTHPVLSELSSGANFKTVKFLGINFYIHLADKSKIVCIDDPLVILLLNLKRQYRGYDIIFYSLELYEKQLPTNSVYNAARNMGFYILNYISQRQAHTVIFPSKLRLNYFKNREFLTEKSCIIYNKPDFSHEQAGYLKDSVKDWINKQKQKGHDIIVFAGGLSSGRSIDLIIDKLNDSSRFSLVLAGEVRDIKLHKKLSSSDKVLYIGQLSRSDVFALYKVADFGLLSYDNQPKNSELCAPIKIWEYHHFGLGIIGNKNKALLDEWSPLIDFFYEDNDLEELSASPMKYSSDIENPLSISQSFSQLLKSINL